MSVKGKEVQNIWLIFTNHLTNQPWKSELILKIEKFNELNLTIFFVKEVRLLKKIDPGKSFVHLLLINNQ